MRFAVIDLGTNTFNLLIAEKGNASSINILHEKKLPVKLGEGGMVRKRITPEAWERGINAIDDHLKAIRQSNVSEIVAYATSATRNAENGKEFVDEILKRFGIKVNVIDGESEAEYIYYGVRQVLPLGDGVSLIMDIGGGSNELILGNAQQVFWMQSFDLGVSRLLQIFNPSNPIIPDEVQRIEVFFEKELQPFFKAVEKFSPDKLVGSSGSFDTYRSMLTKAGILPSSKGFSIEIPVNHYYDLHHRLLKSTREERLKMDGLEPMRADFIVLASLFTNFILKRSGVIRMYQSSFALKEGALWKILFSD